MRPRIILFLLLALLVLTGCSSAATSDSTESQTADSGTESNADPIYFVDEYSETRDPEEDLAQAIAEAQRSERRIFLEIGGEWCAWCHILDDFLNEHDTVATTLKDNFVVVKINVSPDNENEAFMSNYPEVAGYPHFYILEANGDLLHSQNTALLEAGESYDPQDFLAFLQKWSSQ